jgi:tetratricopeptide (TPR) repeat protein
MPSAESDLVIVSVVRYADSCDPIRRHNDCPFAVEHEGMLTCHEECRGVIKSLLRRGRSEPASRSQAFDAGQLRLSEPDGSPDVLWYTSSLLQEVIKAVRTFPIRKDGSLALRRLVYATSALGALGCRGLDPEQLVRRGLTEPVKLALAAYLAKTPHDQLKNWEYMAEWRTMFEESVTWGGDSPESYFRAVLDGPIAQYLDAWIATASIKDVLLWKPPASGAESQATESTQEDIEVWTWIVERFTQTYLDKWSLSSLKREYAFVQGSWQPEFSTEVLAERVVNREEVAIALADRAVESSDTIGPAMMNAFTDQALNLLRDRQRTAAASLFKVALMSEPNDVTAMNNYAFCIVLDKPDEAKSLLVEVLERGARNPAVTWCNLALAESLLGEVDAALNACEQAYQAERTHLSAPLWGRRDGDWVVERVKPQVCAVRLAAELEQAGKASSDVWTKRLKDLNLDSQATSSDPSSAETNEEGL